MLETWWLALGRDVDGIVDAPEDWCNGGGGGRVLEGAADVLALGSVKAPDTKLLELVLLRRCYECWTRGRGEGPQRRWGGWRPGGHVGKRMTVNSNRRGALVID
jgi:hypothetical protein